MTTQTGRRRCGGGSGGGYCGRDRMAARCTGGRGEMRHRGASRTIGVATRQRRRLFFRGSRRRNRRRRRTSSGSGSSSSSSSSGGSFCRVARWASRLVARRLFATQRGRLARTRLFAAHQRRFRLFGLSLLYRLARTLFGSLFKIRIHGPAAEMRLERGKDKKKKKKATEPDRRRRGSRGWRSSCGCGNWSGGRHGLFFLLLEDVGRRVGPTIRSRLLGLIVDGLFFVLVVELARLFERNAEQLHLFFFFFFFLFFFVVARLI